MKEDAKKGEEKVINYLRKNEKIIVLVKYKYNKSKDVYEATIKIYNSVEKTSTYNKDGKEEYYLQPCCNDYEGIVTANLFGDEEEYDNECILEAKELKELEKLVVKKIEEVKREKKRRLERMRKIEADEILYLI